MADEDDIRDIVGREHFPCCPCFEAEDSSSPSDMYVAAQEAAQHIFASAMQAGFCEASVPYLVAMTTDMMVSMFASFVTAHRHPELGDGEITPETTMEFSEECRKMYVIVRERLAALEQRGVEQCISNSRGSSRVH